MADQIQSAEQVMEQALALINQGCDLISGIDVGSPEEKKLRPAITLLKTVATIVKSVPDAGENATLRWRLYQAIQAQEGGGNAALYKELRCSIHLGLAGECSDPVTLPCGHSFCKTCIAPLYYAGVAYSQRKCPQCRVSISVPYSSLKTNFAINGVTTHLLPLGTRHDDAAIAAAEAQVTGGAANSGSSHYGGSGSTYQGGGGSTYQGGGSSYQYGASYYDH